MKPNLSGNFSVWLVLGAFSIYILYRLCIVQPNLKKELSKEYSITVGKFETFGRFEVGVSTWTRFTYEHDNETYSKRIMYKVPCKSFDINDIVQKQELLGIRFPVAVSEGNPKNAIPLLRPEDFEVIGESFPDSCSEFYRTYLKCTYLEEHLY